MEPIRVFAGYDPDEALAFSVFAHSVHRQASRPVSVQPVMLSQLKGKWHRPRDPLQSTEFAFSRFLVPWLCGYQGWAIFADGDMLCLADVAELWALRDEQHDVMVVKHICRDAPAAGADTKFLGRAQTHYPRKYWSSLMLLNCARCTALTPGYVAQAPGLELHQLAWTELIGELPDVWNHLVGVDAHRSDARIAHYTLGMPFFHGFRECRYAAEWRAEKHLMMAYAGRGD